MIVTGGQSSITMQPQDLDHVGEEPIYCETQHDDILYSGSEDDYYEAPEHRRLRIEAKAVQFLNGNLPYLLSARLKGPFDSKSWNNPWKSKRAQRQAARLKSQSQSRRSVMTVEVGRGHSSGKATDDLPDTQRTSLYPLPSPETTNPPSARKNPYMAEAEFNRIKTWRETVKSVPVSTDPFWASQHDERHQSTTTSKRSADQDWLRKRGSKKRKSEDLRKLALEESPSQTAARMRRSLLQDRLGEIVTQSAPGSSTHEDELAAQWGPNTASFDTSRMAFIPTNTPGLLQTTRSPQLLKRQLLAQDPESSEDELSMPSVPPSRNASRSPLKQSLNSNAEKTPSRRPKLDGRDASRSRGCIGASRLELGSDVSMSQQSFTRRSDHVSNERGNKAEQLSAAQIARQDIGAGQLDASQTHIPMRQMVAQAKTMKLEKRALRRAPGSSQQDNSFHFHQAASKSTSTKRDVLPRIQKLGTTLNPTFSGHGAPTLGNELANRAVDHLCAEDGRVCAPAPSDHHMDVVPTNNQGLTSTVLVRPSKAIEHMKVADEVSRGNRGSHIEINEVLPMVESRSGSQAHSNAGPELSTHACTQELSPVSMQHKVQSPRVSTHTAEDLSLTKSPAVDSNDPSNLDWSTYINTQELSAASEKPSAYGEVPMDTEAVPKGADNTNDPDWATYVNTQDILDPSIENGTASTDEDRLLTTEQGHDRTADPDFSASVNTQERHAVETPCEEVAVREDAQKSDLRFSNHKVTDSFAVGTDANSDTSIYLSASLQGDVDQTGDIGKEPVVNEVPAGNSRCSQVTLDSIIDAYSRSQEPRVEFKTCPEGRSPAGDDQNPYAVIQCQDARVTQETEGGRQADLTVPVEGNSSIPMASMEESPQPKERIANLAFNFDETTASLDSPIPSVGQALIQSPWTRSGIDLPMPVVTSKNTTSSEGTSRLSFLAGQALAFSPAPQTPWVEGRLPSPDFSLSVKKFSDFMIPSPSKKRPSADGSILRGASSTSRGLSGTPSLSKPKRRVTFAPLPGEEGTAPAVPESKTNDIFVEEDISYFDANGHKTASIRITRSQNRAASPPPTNVDTANGDELPDHDDKFARHFAAMSKRNKDPPRKTQRLLPPESQQTNSSQPIDAMAEAFIQASQTRKKSSELVEAVDDNVRLVQSSSEKTTSPMLMGAINQQENIDPVDDVSAVLDNIDDFLNNSWGFDTSLNVDMEKEAPTKQQAETVSSRFANVGDPMVAMHANVWAD